MPIRSLGDAHAGSIRDLGLPGRAVTALAGAGVTSVEDLAALSQRELVAIKGLGPGLVAAIRLVVPEPATGVRRSGSSAEVEEESPDAPTIPSFDSLRGPRRRTAMDLLVPEPPAEPPPAAAARAGGPRPAEYADLLRLGLRMVRGAVGVPVRVARWSVREPVRCLRRRLGG